jgi:transposase-like protein
MSICLARKQRSNSWSNEEKILVKLGFLSGKRIKTIASEIGRSETAVNKFLSRSGIRCKRQKTQTKQSKQLREQKPMQSELETPLVDKIQANILFVIDYLKRNGFKISKLSQQPYTPQLLGYDYLCNGKPITEAKLLLFANRLRVENNMPIFCIDSITW